jgi:dipicolinate synthase subunit A
MPKYDIGIVGGDRRTSCMASVLASKGFRVVCFNTLEAESCHAFKNRIFFTDSLREAVSQSSVLIGGIPFTKSDYIYCEKEADISISDFQRCLHKHQKIFAGIIPADFRRVCEEREIGCYDFMLDEPMTLQNAVATAEGAILEALVHKNTTLHKSPVLLLGFGRCGKMLADRLAGFHACITVCSADTTELSLASALGFDTLALSRLCQNICRYEYIFNTIPFQVLNGKCLEKISLDTLVIDIASNKAGADYEAAARLNVNIHFCPGLPGKYSAKSCAELLTEYVISRI